MFPKNAVIRVDVKKCSMIVTSKWFLRIRWINKKIFNQVLKKIVII